MTAFGFLGFGQVARSFAVGMRRRAGDTLLAYTRGLDLEDAPALRRTMAELDVVPVDLAGLRDAEVVLSLVTPATTRDAAVAYEPHGEAGQRYVDLNSAAPSIKLEVADRLVLRGLVVLDGVMTGGGVHLDGHRLPISLSGPGADELVELFRERELVAEAVGSRVGQAAAMKMLRGVVIKGLEALSIEAMLAARAHGVEELVLESLSESLDRWPIRDYIEALVTTHTQYCGRRSVEVAMIRDTVEDAGIPPVMAEAMWTVFTRSAGQDLRVEHGEPQDLEQSLTVLGRALEASLPGLGTSGTARL